MIHGNLKLVRIWETSRAVAVTGIAHQLNFDLVVTILWEVMAKYRSAPRAERQSLDALILSRVCRDAEIRGYGSRRRRSDRRPANGAGDRQILLESRLADAK